MISVRFSLALLMLVFSTAGKAAEPESDQWQFTVTPYLWLATIKGTTGSTADPAASSINYNFLSLDNLDSAFFIAASASRGRWTIQTDIMFLNFSDSSRISGLESNGNRELTRSCGTVMGMVCQIITS